MIFEISEPPPVILMTTEKDAQTEENAGQQRGIRQRGSDHDGCTYVDHFATPCACKTR